MNIEKFFKEGKINFGYLYEKKKKILVIQNNKVQKKDLNIIYKYSTKNKIDSYFSADLIKINKNYYFPLLYNWIYLGENNKMIGFKDIEDNNYNFKEILNYFMNNTKDVLLSNAYEKLKDKFKEYNFKLIDVGFSKKFKYIEDVYNIYKNKFDVIFIFKLPDNYIYTNFLKQKLNYRILIKPKLKS